jgi:hypothetical protein
MKIEMFFFLFLTLSLVQKTRRTYKVKTLIVNT